MISTYFGQCKVIVAQEMGLWHMSISCKKRLPTWEELRDARYKYLPADITVAMLLPPKEEWVNAHSFCFHLWEITKEEHPSAN